MTGRALPGAELPGEPPALRAVTQETYASWEAIYRDNVGRLYRLMYAKVGNRADAEDLTAEVFLAAVPRLRTSATVAEVRSYLSTIARTVLAGHWRKTLGRPVTALPEQTADPPPDLRPAPSGADPPDGRLARVLDALPERYRRILELRFFEACTLRESAARLGVTLTNAKVLQYRALRRATQLAEEMGT